MKNGLSAPPVLFPTATTIGNRTGGNLSAQPVLTTVQPEVCPPLLPLLNLSVCPGNRRALVCRIPSPTSPSLTQRAHRWPATAACCATSPPKHSRTARP